MKRTKNYYFTFILLFCSCSAAQLVIKDKCNEDAIESYIYNSIKDKNYIPSEKAFYVDFYRKEAQKTYCIKDSVIVYGKKTIPYNQASQRIKDKITNIMR